MTLCGPVLITVKSPMASWNFIVGKGLISINSLTMSSTHYVVPELNVVSDHSSSLESLSKPSLKHWLPYQILYGKPVKNVQIDPQTTEIWTKKLNVP